MLIYLYNFIAHIVQNIQKTERQIEHKEPNSLLCILRNLYTYLSIRGYKEKAADMYLYPLTSLLRLKIIRTTFTYIVEKMVTIVK